MSKVMLWRNEIYKLERIIEPLSSLLPTTSSTLPSFSENQACLRHKLRRVQPKNTNIDRLGEDLTLKKLSLAKDKQNYSSIALHLVAHSRPHLPSFGLGAC
jgi:hypothetical protein